MLKYIKGFVEKYWFDAVWIILAVFLFYNFVRVIL